jgi:hypothetical protein
MDDRRNTSVTAASRIDLPPTPPYIWEPGVELPPGPTGDDIAAIYQALQSLGNFQPEAPPRRSHPRLVSNTQEIIRVLHYSQPILDGANGTRQGLHPVLYLFYQPLLFGPADLRIRVQTSLGELNYLSRLDGTWREFWRRAILSLELWVEEEPRLRTLDESLRATWEGLPTSLTRDMVLAQFARAWLEFARQRCLVCLTPEEQDTLCPSHLMQASWDHIHSLGGWSCDFLRSWRAGLFDVKWYYILQESSASPERMYQQLLSDYRQCKGRYLMFYEPRHPYALRRDIIGEALSP